LFKESNECIKSQKEEKELHKDELEDIGYFGKPIYSIKLVLN
jgi:hypothetical protein